MASYTARLLLCFILLCVNNGLIASPALKTFMEQVWENNSEIKSTQAALDAAIANKLASDQPIYNPELSIGVERTSYR